MSNAIKCDNCGKFAERPTASGYARMRAEGWKSVDMPDGWVTLRAHRFPHEWATESDCHGEFCGWTCASDWLDTYAENQAAGQ